MYQLFGMCWIYKNKFLVVTYFTSNLYLTHAYSSNNIIFNAIFCKLIIQTYKVVGKNI